MIFSALFSFLGGSAFRTIWGEVAAWVNKKQDHEHEIERMNLQAQLDDKAHANNLENLRLQAQLNVQQVEVQKDADVARAEADAFTKAMGEAFKPTGITWVDAWNGCIRPAAATVALALWVLALVQAGFVTSDWDKELVGVVLGFYFADRSLGKRNK